MRLTGRTVALVWMVAGLMAAATAQAGTMYSVREDGDTLVSIDTDTLEITVIGSLGMQFQFGGLAWNSHTSTLFMVDGWGGRNALWTVDTDTGQATLVGIHGEDSMFGLTYDASTDTLYGSESTRSKGFWKLDQNTGEATAVGDPGINLDGLAYDPGEDMVVGALAGPGSLHEIDRSNGSQTLLFDGDFFNNGGLTYDPEKDLLWFIDWSGMLYTFDPNNGYARTTRASGLGPYDGLAFILEGGGKCNYTIKKSKARGGCGSCPAKGEGYESQARCEIKKDCKKKIKTTLNCPQGEGTCKIKAKKRKCE